MGEVKHVLAESDYTPDALPWSSRFIIEDCVGETVHLHMGNIRTEFTPDQFLWFADHVAAAANRMRAIRKL